MVQSVIEEPKWSFQQSVLFFFSLWKLQEISSQDDYRYQALEVRRRFRWFPFTKTKILNSEDFIQKILNKGNESI